MKRARRTSKGHVRWSRRCIFGNNFTALWIDFRLIFRYINSIRFRRCFVYVLVALPSISACIMRASCICVLLTQKENGEHEKLRKRRKTILCYVIMESFLGQNAFETEARNCFLIDFSRPRRYQSPERKDFFPYFRIRRMPSRTLSPVARFLLG